MTAAKVERAEYRVNQGHPVFVVTTQAGENIIGLGEVHPHILASGWVPDNDGPDSGYVDRVERFPASPGQKGKPATVTSRAHVVGWNDQEYAALVSRWFGMADRGLFKPGQVLIG